jgi:hypothetical protein
MLSEALFNLFNLGVQVTTEKRRTDIIEVGAPVSDIQSYQKIGRLSDSESLAMQRTSPLWNKVSDTYIETLTVGFEYEYLEETISKELKAFHRKINLMGVLEKVVADALCFNKGGFMEVVFPDNLSSDQPFYDINKNVKSVPKKYVSKNMAFRLEWIDPVTMENTPVKQTDRSKENYGEILYFVQYAAKSKEASGAATQIRIHPDRIFNLELHHRSCLAEKLYNVILPLENMFISCGRIIKRKGNPFLEVILEFWDKKLVQEAEERLRILNERHEFIHDKRIQPLQVPEIGSRALNPTPYAEIEWKGLAAGSGIPETLLFGAGQGTLSTSDINMQDWFNTASCFQDKITPLIIFLDSLYWEMVHGEKKVFPIKWNDLYPPDQERDSKIRKTNAETDRLYLDTGIVTPELLDKDREKWGLHPLFDEYNFEMNIEAHKVFVSGQELRANVSQTLNDYRIKLIEIAASILKQKTEMSDDEIKNAIYKAFLR